MYVPARFAERDRAAVHAVIRANGFGLLVTTGADGAPVATHLPFRLEAERGAEGTLVAHMARANPHWRAFAGAGLSLAVFQGPHAYVSPTTYEPGDAVPTWNYVAVHAYGQARVIEDEAEVHAAQAALVDALEAGREPRWRLEEQDPAYVRKMLAAIVAFEMPIEHLEAAVKMSQNKTAADRAGVIADLAASDDPAARAVADLMRAREAAAEAEGPKRG